MITTVLTASGLTGLHVDHDRSVIWLSRDDGALLSTDLAGNASTHQLLPVPVTDVAGSSALLVLAGTDGSLWRVDPDDPATAAVSFATLPAAPAQIAVVANGANVLSVDGTRARSTSVRFGTGRRYQLPDGSVGVAISGRRVGSAANDPNTGESRLHVRPATDSDPTAPLGRVGFSADGTTLFAARPDAVLSAWTPADGTLRSESIAAVGASVIEAQGLADGRIAVLTDTGLALLDSLDDLVVVAPPRPPVIVPPAEPMFVASWTRLDYDLGDSGLTPAQIGFVVPDGPEAGIVSHTRENDFGDPTPILVAGGRLGRYKVVMIETATNAELAVAEFEVGNEWDSADEGPSTMITGRSREFAGDSGWGGGPAGPQNLGDLTHLGSWRVLVLLVDTRTARWPAATLANDRATALRHVTDGFDVGGGVLRSARDYYEENSGNQLTLAVRNNTTFGPVAMPLDWESYFFQLTNAAGVVTDARWRPTGTNWQQFLTQAINDGVVTTADLRAVDSVIFVPFSPAATLGGDRFAWPFGAIGKQRMLLGTNVVTDQGDVAGVQIPLDFATFDGRHAHATLSHELGHNLGLLDVYNIPEYPADVTDRITADWEMMAGSRNTMPHYTLGNKLRMGWVPAAGVRAFDFSKSSAGVDQTITLHASELFPTPAGRVRGIEIRLGNGWNYYIEYRAEQPGFSTDDLPQDRRVVLTDMISENFTPPILRPRIMFVPRNPDGDDRLLTIGGDFDATDPGTGFALKVDVVSTDADNARVRVRYASDARPELGIRPWDNGPTWQSPDIEVRNAKNAANPALRNVPWAGRPNTIVAKVTNHGDFAAKGVVVDFFVTEYSSGDGPWIPLGSPSRDVGPSATEEFSVSWTPPADERLHYCVIVRIKLYQDAGNPAIVDANIYNNEARSNYTRFISASASPSSRTGAQVLLANPFGEQTLVSAKVRQTNDLHRVFVDHTWLRVDPGLPRPIQVLDEALFDTPEWPWRDGDNDRWRKQLWGDPNLVSVEGWARTPRAEECGGLVPTGGACLSVQAGRQTVTRIEEATPHFAAGTVVFVDNGAGVPSDGVVLIELGDGDESWTVTTRIHADGVFRTELFDPEQRGREPKWLIAHYLGDFGASPSESKREEF